MSLEKMRFLYLVLVYFCYYTTIATNHNNQKMKKNKWKTDSIIGNVILILYKYKLKAFQRITSIIVRNLIF